jgi:hypothetical protein
VTLRVNVGDRDVTVSVGPVLDETVAELERDADDGLGLRRLLETTVDDVSLAQRDGGVWVELRKAHVLAGGEVALLVVAAQQRLVGRARHPSAPASS